MPNILRYGVFLFLVAGLTGLGIAYTNNLTKPVISKELQEQKKRSLKEVFPHAEEIIDESEKYLKNCSEEIVKEVAVAYLNAEPVGFIYTVEPVGYMGRIKTLVGIDWSSQKITSIKIIEQKETPGLGTNCTQEWFKERFAGKDASFLEVTKKEPVEKYQIMAITSATITTQAIVNGVNAALKHFHSVR